MVLALLFALTAPNIDCLGRADRLDNQLAKISTQANVILKAGPDLAREVVFIRGKSLPLPELKSRLANCLGATWLIKEDGEYLDRTPDQKAEIWSNHLTLRKTMIDDAFKLTAKEVQKPFDAAALARGLTALGKRPEYTGNMAEARAYSTKEAALFVSGPMARLLRNLILACNPNDLAGLGPFERRIFKFKPTKRQFGIPEAAFRKAISTFAKEQQAWIDAAQQANFPEDQNGRTVTDPRSQTRYSADSANDVELVVSRGEMTALFNVNLVGKHPDFGRTIVCQASFADTARKFMNSRENQPAPSDKDPLVELSPDSKLFQDRLAEFFTAASPSEVSPELANLLAKSDKNEPMGWTVSDALATYADSQKINMVASLSDQCLMIGAFGTQGQPIRAGNFLRSLVDSGTLAMTQKNGWVELAPVDRWEAAVDYTPRNSAAEMIRSVIAAGNLNVRDYAKYAFESGRISRMGLGDIWLAFYERSLMGVSDFMAWDGLRLYGSFVPNAQRDLEAGKEFPYGGLTAAQKKIVDRLVYAGEIRSEEALGGNSSMTKGEPVEPTEAFPNALPPNIFVTCKTKSTPTLIVYVKTQNGKVKATRKLNPETVAAIEVSAKGNPEMMKNYGVVGLEGYAVGAEKIISLRIVLRPGLWKEYPMSMMDTDPKAKPVAWEQLPEPYKTQISEAITRRRNDQNSNGGVPPPRLP